MQLNILSSDKEDILRIDMIYTISCNDASIDHDLNTRIGLHFSDSNYIPGYELAKFRWPIRYITNGAGRNYTSRAVCAGHGKETSHTL